MRSIRLSLMLYFLGLLTVAVGIASLLVYRVAAQALQEKEEAARRLIDDGYEERCRVARQQLDALLLAKARSIAAQVRPRMRFDRITGSPPHHTSLYHLHGLGLLTSQLQPFGQFAGLLWLQQGTSEKRSWFPRPSALQAFQFHIWRLDLIELGMNADVDLHDEKSNFEFSYLVQTNGCGRPSPRVGELALVPEPDFAPDDRLLWVTDDCVLDGVPARRVRFRALMNLVINQFQGPPSKGASKLPGGPSRAVTQYPPAAIIVQCAADLRELDKDLDALHAKRDEERDALRCETALALARYCGWLWVIFGATFSATAVGSVGLVWLGMRPLHVLSVAVSKISARDFNLDLQNAKMPRELNPIVDRLKETLEQLRRAFEREKQATADISHELRTPLAAMLTVIDLGLRKPRSVEHYREILGDCRASVEQLNQIVERLLTLARLDAGVDKLRSHSVDVVTLAEQCAGVIRPLAEARGLEFSLRTLRHSQESGETQVSTDPDKLREVLNNLLHNAIQYNRPSGKIALSVTRENGHVLLEVQDTGIGIDPDIKDRIFERFYRADPSRTGDGMNAGLGLAIVKEYVELMGGTIRVESVPGQGSTFRIELPADRPTLQA
jgi:signal transduction histidine kinase